MFELPTLNNLSYLTALMHVAVKYANPIILSDMDPLKFSTSQGFNTILYIVL